MFRNASHEIKTGKSLSVNYQKNVLVVPPDSQPVVSPHLPAGQINVYEKYRIYCLYISQKYTTIIMFMDTSHVI